MTPMAAIEIRNVTKRFKTHTVLEDLSLSVDEGETVAIFGPSGCGKTVLLRMIAGVEDPTAGTVHLKGEDVTDLPPEARGVGMAFQNFALFPHMSAFDNIASALTARRTGADALKAGVEKVARLLKIEHVLGHAPRALSNGQKQRTALARALVAEPGILLLDDPLRNVDAKLRFEMRLELPRLLARRRATVLYVTQDFREAMALGERIAVLGDGRIVQLDTPSEIYHRPVSVKVARMFGDPTINVIPTRIEEAPSLGPYATVAGMRVPLPGFAAHVGTDVLLGIRPEAVQPVDPGAAGAIPLVVEAVTPLNEKVVSLLHGPDGLELLVSRPSQETPVPPGRALSVRLPPESILLFDAATGLRVASGALREAA